MLIDREIKRASRFIGYYYFNHISSIILINKPILTNLKVVLIIIGTEYLSENCMESLK